MGQFSKGVRKELILSHEGVLKREHIVVEFSSHSSVLVWGAVPSTLGGGILAYVKSKLTSRAGW